MRSDLGSAAGGLNKHPCDLVLQKTLKLFTLFSQPIFLLKKKKKESTCRITHSCSAAVIMPWIFLTHKRWHQKIPFLSQQIHASESTWTRDLSSAAGISPAEGVWTPARLLPRNPSNPKPQDKFVLAGRKSNPTKPMPQLGWGLQQVEVCAEGGETLAQGEEAVPAPSLWVFPNYSTIPEF